MLDDYITDVCLEEIYRDLDEIEWQLVVNSWSEATYSSQLDD